jgi:hypothetical protein
MNKGRMTEGSMTKGRITERIMTEGGKDLKVERLKVEKKGL